MRNYPKYKDSGTEWCGEIPEAWAIKKVKYLSRYINNPITTNELNGKEVVHYSIPNVQEYGIGILENGDDIDSSKLILQEGLLLLSKLNPRKSTVCLVQHHENQLIVGSGEFIPLHFFDNQEFRYYQFIDRKFTDFLGSQVESVTRSHQRIRPELLFNSFFPTPSPEEQVQIVAFLNQKTSIIDDLIQEKHRKIELLQEHRTSIINQTVTKGLNPNVKMKDSGVEWIGEIPEHWAKKKITYCFQKIGSGTTPPSGLPEYYENGEYNWLQTGDLNDGEIVETSKKITGKALNDFTTLRFYPIDSIVIAMYGATIGKMGILKIETTTNQACCVLSYPQGVDVKFVYYWFLSNKKHIISLSYGGGQPNINQDIIRNLRLHLPSVDEQHQIALFLDDKTTEIDTSINLEKIKINLLKEYRQSLISEVVTGKIDVRKN